MSSHFCQCHAVSEGCIFLLPSPTLKWQVIRPLQLCRKKLIVKIQRQCDISRYLIAIAKILCVLVDQWGATGLAQLAGPSWPGPAGLALLAWSCWPRPAGLAHVALPC